MSELIDSLENGRKHPFHNRGIYKDDAGLLNCPILLRKTDYHSKLVIIAAHRELIDVGASQTLAEVRKEYWIIQGRSDLYPLGRRSI